MSNVYNNTMAADGDVIEHLSNVRGKSRTIYSVTVTGNFGGGTLTAFTNAQGKTNAAAGTGDDAPIKDSSGAAISITANDSFNFEVYSEPKEPTVVKLTLSGSTSPALKVKINRND